MRNAPPCGIISSKGRIRLLLKARLFPLLSAALALLSFVTIPAHAETVLLVVPNPGAPSAQDTRKQQLVESWGYTVNLISASASQAEFDAAVLASHAVYISEEINAGDLGTKLKDAPIGLINEEQSLTDEYGFSSGNGGFNNTRIDIADNTHYITSAFSTGSLTICTSNQPLHTATGTLAGDAQVLAERPSSSEACLLVIETGGALYGGGTAAGRRVHLPWGGNTFNIYSLNGNGQTIMRRAIEWGSFQRTFSDVSSSLGFNVQTTSQRSSGLHWGDLDNDGDLDAVATGHDYARLFINNNAGQSFTASGFGSGDVRQQGALVDFDNDGDLDFWSAQVNGSNNESCFENNGLASFTDIGDLGFSNPSNSEGVAAGDVNGDGWCDIVVFSPNGNWIGHHQGGTPIAFVGTKDGAYGMNDGGDCGNGDYCSSGDVNNDGFLDFFYHFGGGKLFLSNGDGTYTENASGISVVTGNNREMGSAWGDYDNDGDLDLFVCRRDDGQRGYLWRRDADGSFTDVTASAGITDTSPQTGCCWGDYDNDGDLDLYIVTHGGANVLYQNQGGGAFQVANAGAEASGNGYDGVFVDYDNDGDLDLAITQLVAPSVLLRNDTDNSNYLKVRVLGPGKHASNQAVPGTRIELYDVTGTLFIARREMGTARGFAGIDAQWVHFGGLNNTATYTVKVYFSGRPVGDPYVTTVVPADVSTTIGGTVIPQMLTIQESGLTITKWREVIR